MEEKTSYFYKNRLREELSKRLERNPRYSLRSFATAIGMNSSDLSQILAGTRSVSTKIADRILSHLEMSIEEQKYFLESILEEKKKKGLKRTSPKLQNRLNEFSKVATKNTTRGVGLDEFRVISDWFHAAIMELTTSKYFKYDPRWIAKQLNLPVTEVKLAIDRLIDLEILVESNGTLQKTNQKFDTKDKSKTSLFHRRRQKQILEKSIHSLEHDSIEERNHSGITLCIDPKHLPEAKVKIQNLMWELSQFLIEGEPERVYELNVNLFPLQNKNETVSINKKEKQK